MTEETNPAPTELDLLKKRAKMLGVNPGNMGVDKLKEKIDAKVNGGNDGDDTEEASEAKPLTKMQREQQIREKLQRDKMALVRCQIYNLNPSKRDLKGEIITVGNKYLGTVRKFIPFGDATENGYHLPKVLFNDLKKRKFQQVTTTRKNGQIEVKTRMVPEYNLVELPPLTTEELKELAMKQAAAERVGVE